LRRYSTSGIARIPGPNAIEVHFMCRPYRPVF
jgi:hypothetical protein